MSETGSCDGVYSETTEIQGERREKKGRTLRSIDRRRRGRVLSFLLFSFSFRFQMESTPTDNKEQINSMLKEKVHFVFVVRSSLLLLLVLSFSGAARISAETTTGSRSCKLCFSYASSFFSLRMIHLRLFSSSSYLSCSCSFFSLFLRFRKSHSIRHRRI